MRNDDNRSTVRARDSLVILAVIAALIAAFVVQASKAAVPPPQGQASTREVLQDAAERFEKQDYAGAREQYQRATKLDAGSLPAWRGLGWSHWRLGEEDRALEIWNDILKVNAGDSETLLALAQAYDAREDWTRATEFYAAALKRPPGKVAAYVGRARIHQRFDRFREAEADLRAALALAPNDFDAQYLLALNYKATGRAQDASAILAKLAKQDAGPRSWRLMADVLLELDRAPEALAYYRKNLAQHPDNRGTIQGLARAEARLGRYPDAIGRLERFVAEHPNDTAMRDDLVRFASASGDHARATRHLRVLARQHPDETRWAMKLARSLRDGGNASEAGRVVAKVLERDPRDTAALEFQLQQAMLRGSDEEAMQRLVALTEADPTERHWVRLGGAWIRQGDEYADDRNSEKALDAYQNAAKAYLRAIALDPQDADAVLGAATALRLSGDPQRAADMAQRIADQYPGAGPAWRELFEARMQMGDYRGAEAVIQKWRAQYPRSVHLRQDYNRTRFLRGAREAAIADLQALLREPIKQGVPVLLYHGITESAPGEDAMPVKNFNDQMRALKNEGYTTISLQQLIAWRLHGGALPDKPVLITFDDARADSFRYADPVLERYGFHAVMFAPTAEVGRHGDYNAPWSVMRALRASGRWDIQCHSHAGHSPIVVDASGRKAPFLVNRMWLKKAGRLETRAEFESRLEGDYRQCAEALRRELPGTPVAGYAYPFGEYGQKAMSNEPQALTINAKLVKRYYRAGFVQDTAFQATKLSDPLLLERFEVPWDYSGKQLVSRLRKLNPYASTELLIADLYSWDGRYAAANGMLDKVAKAGRSDKADVMARRGRVTMWQGDFAAARMYLASASGTQGLEPIARQSMAELDRRVRPALSVDGDTQVDNHERDSLSIGPDERMYLSDRVMLTLGGRYKEFSDGRYGAAGATDLSAVGQEVQLGAAFRINWRTSMTASASYARFADTSPGGTGDRDFIPYSVGLDIPFGESADWGLRAHHGYIDAAGAVLTDMTATGLQQRLQWHPRRNTTLNFMASELSYSDSNRRSTLEGKALWRVVEAANLQVGYRFRYDNTRDFNPYFYTPDNYVGNDAIAQVETDWYGARYGLEGALGMGKEQGTDAQFQASVYGTARYAYRDLANVWLSAGQNQAADYRAFQVLGGLTLTFN